MHRTQWSRPSRHNRRRIPPCRGRAADPVRPPPGPSLVTKIGWSDAREKGRVGPLSNTALDPSQPGVIFPLQSRASRTVEVQEPSGGALHVERTSSRERARTAAGSSNRCGDSSRSASPLRLDAEERSTSAHRVIERGPPGMGIGEGEIIGHDQAAAPLRAVSASTHRRAPAEAHDMAGEERSRHAPAAREPKGGRIRAASVVLLSVKISGSSLQGYRPVVAQVRGTRTSRLAGQGGFWRSCPQFRADPKRPWAMRSGVPPAP